MIRVTSLITKQNVKHSFLSTANSPQDDGAKRRARVLIPPGYLHPGKRKQ
jgi:hypothetical protein